MKSHIKSVFYLVLIESLFSCKNSDAELIAYNVPDPASTTVVDNTNMTIEVTFPESVTSASGLEAEFEISEGARAYVGNVEQFSGQTKNDFEEPMEFSIVSEDENTSNSWQIVSKNNDFSADWGLGGFIQEELSLDKTYEWYIDQSSTGTFSDVNCAPSCVVMASHWRDESFANTVVDARKLYHSTGGGWYTEDVDNCLTDFNTEHSIVSLSSYRSESTQMLIDELKQGNIILLAIDIYYLKRAIDDSCKTDRYYDVIELGTGHCIVIKGYKKVDGNIFYEVYDPIGYSFKYEDGSYKGRNRYYSADDIYTAAFASWNYGFIIQGPGNKKSVLKSVNISDIPNIRIL